MPHAAAALAAALALLATGQSSALDVQAHRGGRGLAPENSLTAVRESIDLLVPTLELDLQATRDRVLVVSHDTLLDPDRCRGLDALPTRRLSGLAAADIAGVRCDGEPIATLDDVLALARDAPYPVGLSLEIKNQDGDRGIPVADIASILVDAVGRHGLADRVIVQSFDPQALRATRRLAPSMRTAILARDRDDYDRLLEESGAGILSPRADDLAKEDVERCHRRGIAVIPWVVDDPEDAARLASWGVDGLISDRPDRIMKALDVAPAARRAMPGAANAIELAPGREPEGTASAPAMAASGQPATSGSAAAMAASGQAAGSGSAPALAPPASPPSAPRQRALELEAVRVVAVYPFTSGGNVDTFCTSLFMQEVERQRLFRRIVDPYELSVTIPDGQPFQPQAMLQDLLAEAREKGADALIVGEGRWYDLGFRTEVRLIEVNEGRVLWQCAHASGFTFSGPSAKRELARKAVRDLERALD